MQTEIIIKKLQEDVIEFFRTDSSEDINELKLDLTPLLENMSNQLILPIISGFISTIIYDKYKEIKSSRQAKKALQEIEDMSLKRDLDVEAEFIKLKIREILVDNQVPDAEKKIDNIYNLLIQRTRTYAKTP